MIIEVAILAGAGIVLVGATVTLIRSDRLTTQTEPASQDDVDEEAADFEPLHSMLFTTAGFATLPPARRKAGRHRPYNVDPAPADYLIPNTYAALLAQQSEQVSA